MRDKKKSFIKKLKDIIPLIIKKKIDLDIAIVDITVSNDMRYIVLHVYKNDSHINDQHKYLISLLRSNISRYIKLRFVPNIQIKNIQCGNIEN